MGETVLLSCAMARSGVPWKQKQALVRLFFLGYFDHEIIGQQKDADGLDVMFPVWVRRQGAE